MLATATEPCVRSAGRRLPRFASAALLLAALSCDTPLDPRIDLVLSQPSVEFRAVRGSSDPLTRTVTVSNGGGGRLGPVSCPEAPAPWLACAVNEGSSVVLTADPAGIEESPEPATVSLTAPGASGATSLTVELVIEQPVLTVSAGTLAFTATEGTQGTTPPSANVTVTNTGAGTLASLGGVSCAPTPATTRVTCSVNQGDGVLTVTVDPEGLAAGTYVYPLTVGAPNASVSQTVSVTVTVSSLPRIALSQQALHFEAIRGTSAPIVRTVTVSNAGGGSLGTVSCPANPSAWLTCSVSGGTTVTFTASAAGLAATPAPVSVNVSATGATNSSQPVQVTFAIEQPVLALSRSALAFAAVEGQPATTPASDTVRVTNAGAGTLANLGAISCTPREDSPVSCAVSASTGVLTLTVDATEIPAGVTVHPVVVAAPHSAVERTLTVTVSRTAPRIVLSPSSLNFEAIRGTTASVTRTVSVTNPGGGSLGTIACPANPAPWLTCAVTDTTRLTLTANPTGLAGSPADVEVVVTASGAVNGSDTLAVAFTIQQPVLSLSTSRVDFDAELGGSTTDPASRVVTVSNTGAGTLANLGAISCVAESPAACASNQATGELTLTIDPSGLAAGTHVRFVSVTAPHVGNAAQIVAIVLTVD